MAIPPRPMPGPAPLLGSERHIFLKIQTQKKVREMLDPIQDIYLYIPKNHPENQFASKNRIGNKGHLDTFTLQFTTQIQSFFDAALHAHLNATEPPKKPNNAFENILLGKSNTLFKKPALKISPEPQDVAIDERFFMNLNLQGHPLKHEISTLALELTFAHSKIDALTFLNFFARFCASKHFDFDLHIHHPLSAENKNTLSSAPELQDYPIVLQSMVEHLRINRHFLPPPPPSAPLHTSTDPQPNSHEHNNLSDSAALNSEQPAAPLRRKIIRY